MFPKGLLVAGTSHCGKSTFAEEVANRTGVALFSTDRMARHPGRPWPTPRSHVVDYYAHLSDASRDTLLQHHYQTMRGLIELAISDQCKVSPYVIEGSALRAEDIARYQAVNCKMICLHACPKEITTRIYASSDYTSRYPDHRQIIDAFVRRSLADQENHLAIARENNVPCFDTTAADTKDEMLAWAQVYLTDTTY